MSVTSPRAGQGAAGDAGPAPVLAVQDLVVEIATARGVIRPVDGVSWSVGAGEIMALVGESGCGKSISALAVMRLLPRPAARVAAGRILFDGADLLTLPERQMRARRGRDLAMVFQEPMTSLNPVLTIGEQVGEPLQLHQGLSKRAARGRAAELLAMVGIPDPDGRLDQHPHQFSGGMRQRVMIAIALACNPRLIIADEPTTALDVTIQAQLLQLMRDLCTRLRIALVIITHNLGIVARYADQVAVMYAGRVVEQSGARRLFAAPRHPYTIGLLGAVPRLDRPRTRQLATVDGTPPDLLDPPCGCRFAARCFARADICAIDPPLYEAERGHLSACHRIADLAAGVLAPPVPAQPPAEAAAIAATPLLRVRGLTKHFALPRRAVVHAVEDVSFDVPRGRTLGIVGESGCGKSTVGRMILRLETPTAGAVDFEGQDMAAAAGPALAKLRPRIQAIFQDPCSSLNPRMSVGDIIAEPLLVHRRARDANAAWQRTAALLEQVGLPPQMAERYPHQLSGGQRQRVGIARALALEPDLIVCDEAVSALDVSIQGQIVNLLDELQRRLGLSYVFIAHDLAVVRHLAHRVVVMYLGHVMEMADRDSLYAAPLHPYTLALLDAAPVPDPMAERARVRPALAGEPPSPLQPPPGCVFHTRCPRADGDCQTIVPPLREIRAGHFAACVKL
jgi:peptide/nickel transport system ATP-binding protein